MSGAARRALLASASVLATLASVAWAPMAAAAMRLPHGFHDRPLVGGLRFPVGMAFVPDGRLLVVEREAGVVKVILTGSPIEVVPILQVEDVRVDFYEQGLLGIAVDPEWPVRPYVYLYYDALDFTIRISRYRASGDLSDPASPNLALDPASRYDILSDVPDTNESHNGGTLRFGPDGMLYAGLADDWAPCAAQDSVSLRGALLRMDVSGLPDGPGGPADKASIAPADNPFANHADPDARLVWATGFRNPFRFHVDPVSGDLFVTDVGWSSFEEIDHVDGPGQNFGWPHYEGNQALQAPCTPGPGVLFAPPIHVEDRRAYPNSALVSAGVYRPAPCVDCNFPPEYDGDYFYSDFHREFLRRLERTESGWVPAAPAPGQPTAFNWADRVGSVTDFAVGPDGALWYCRTTEGWMDYSGLVGRIVHVAPGLAAVDGASSGTRFAPPAPSPAHGRVQFSFTLERSARARLEIFDLAGRRVLTLLDAELAAGSHRTSWSPHGERAAGAGIYFARLTAEGVTRRHRFVIAR